MKQWKNNNQDNYKQYQKQWKINNQDKYKQYKKKYREKQKLKKQEQPTTNTYNVQNMTVNNYNNDSTA